MSSTDIAEVAQNNVGVVWGKWDGAANSYPLAAHLLDTAAFAAGLWDVTLSTTTRDRLGEGFGGDSVAARAGFAFVAAAHDCGKADPWFQGQLASRRVAEFAANSELLSAAGLSRFPGSAPLVGRVKDNPMMGRLLRHEAGSAAALERSGAPSWVVAAVSGHHGRYMPDAPPAVTRPVDQYRAWVAGSGWAVEQSRDLQRIANAVGWEGFAAGAAQTRSVGALIPLMTGLICLADWCASDEMFIASAPLELLYSEPGEYFRRRSSQALALIPTTIGVPVRPRGTFAQVFPGFSPSRDSQRWAVEQGLHGPGLTLITVPMGEGKTETALWMHAASEVGDGLVFALPTMATADAMFTRIQRFYASTPALAALRHGQAVLNSFYDPATVTPTGVCDGAGGLTGSEWLRGRHRSLTAPVTVSSCDQVLAAAVNHKFLPVRLASLASKHVVLDEVHTYDPYQDLLLIRLLGWLGRYGARVTLLSATLPTRRAADYARAYAEGAGATLSGEVRGLYPCVTSTAPDGQLTQVQLGAHRSYEHRVSVAEITVGSTNYEEFVDEFAVGTATLMRGLREENPDSCMGLIVNTVNRAIAVARSLGGEVTPLVIHARMTAAQRAEKTKALLEMTGPDGTPGPLTVIATQIAEASLDIDFDVLVCDLAPMTSLLQRMGRQWRQSHVEGSAWIHPPRRRRTTPEPVVHVLVARDVQGARHRHAAVPYSHAEIDKTLAAGLDGGARDRVAIPGDLQVLVDGCDVTFADLTIDDADVASVQNLMSHLGKQAADAGAAMRVGTDLTEFEQRWEYTPRWDSNAMLDGFTEGTLWDAEALTRLREGANIQLLIYDPTGLTRYAYPDNMAGLMASLQNPDVVNVALSCVLPVSGNLATKILRSIDVPNGWQTQATAILRSLRPIAISELASLGLTLHPDLGLTSE